MYDSQIEWSLLLRAIIPFAVAHIFVLVLVYLTLVRQCIGQAYPYFATFIASFSLFLCGPLINMMPYEPIKVSYVLFRNALLFSVGLPALLNGLFVLAKVPLARVFQVLPYILGALWTVLFALFLPIDHSINFSPSSRLIHLSQVSLVTSCLLIPCLYLLLQRPSRFVAIFILGAVNLGLFMLIGSLLKAWSLYYAGSSLTVIIWAAAVFKDIQQTNRKLEQHHKHEKALAKAQYASSGALSCSDYYPAERDLAYPVKQREELIEVVKTASLGLIETKATALFTKLKQFTHDNINTLRVRIKEVLFMLYDTAIFTGADGQPLIQRLESLSNQIDDCESSETIFKILIDECQFLAQTITATPSQNSEDKLVEDIKTYLHTYYYKDVTINDVASEVRVSRSHIMRVFKAATGQTITQFLANVRVNRAKILLLSHTVTEVAFEVGFNNSTYFSTVFKKLTGVTPSRYQQDAKQQSPEQASTLDEELVSNPT
ncbi:helix-turn-helix transcriptional regulator [Vibrio sp. WXL210]|uniref:helix-turn-helix transcriptional regulator n=1 Tax=Vibrio sp. WXL210 TaxID=3450709 RepID=UPI003EC8D3E3